ncbi:IS3 family transposase [Bacillus sp. FJAT-28004]
MTEEFIHFYNEERIQINLKKLTPKEYRCQLSS